jgi:glutathionylspermidine synthase
MTSNGQHFCLRWNNYQANMTSVFHQLLTDEAFVDVTLACNEETLKAHKVRARFLSLRAALALFNNMCIYAKEEKVLRAGHLCNQRNTSVERETLH